MTNNKTCADDSAPLYNPEDPIFGANANPELQAKALGLVNKSKKDWAKRKVCKECQCESYPEAFLPCPHSRESWKNCPHCLGINNPKNDQSKT